MYKIFTLAAAIAILPVSQKIQPDAGTSQKRTAIHPLDYTLKTKPAFNPFWLQTTSSTTNQPIDQHWLAAAEENIRKSEYQFKWEEELKAYCTPNRKNNLRFFYNEDGFSVEPRTTKIPIGNIDPKAGPDKIKYRSIPNWKINFDLDKNQVGKGKWQIVDNKAEYTTGKITVEYLNNESGMRQNFIVHSPISNDAELNINFHINTKLKTYLHGNQLQFFHNKNNVLNYNDLKVWDANHKMLAAAIQKNRKGGYNIKVDTKGAVYPITIDPISSTPSSILDDANQAGAQFGISVCSAGDVNGDGYSDVIIGANHFDDGANLAEGRAFVYHGSAAGLSASPNSILDDANQAGADFGISVATAGDVNGDGYSDVIVGAYQYDDGANSAEGRAFVYHGSATGLSASPNSLLDDANQAGANFGVSVACAGDVNGDGYSDVIIGANFYDDPLYNNEGRAFVYHGSATGLAASPNSVLNDANQAGANFGISVASAGDVNGDGFSDVIIGANLYNDGVNADEGRAFVYLGSAAGLLGTPSSVMDDANQINANFGVSVASAGDVNGDGYSDVIIGAYLYNDGANAAEGRAFVYHGSVAGLLGAPSSVLDDANQAGAGFGTSVACAGDVNGDGYSDVIIGASLFDDGANIDEGRAFLYEGSATGLAASPAATPGDANQADANFGIAVASAGDVNGDGYSDVIIGAKFYNDGSNTHEGRAFVYNGSAAGINTTPVATAESNQSFAKMGQSVAWAGDVNGDGYSDVIVGVPNYNDGLIEEGIAVIYHGSATGISTTPATTLKINEASALLGSSVASAGDVNGDGYSDVIVGAEGYQSNKGLAIVFLGSATGVDATLSAARTIRGHQANDYLGHSVASAGDVNGDGYSDVIVGAYLDENGETDEGRAFVFYGKATGIDITPAATLESNQAGARMGNSVASAGDVNGDGYSDVIVGAYLYSNGQSNEGVAYVFHGSATGINTTAAARVEGNQINAWFGFSVAGAGDVNGDGYNDVIIGALNYNNGQADEGAAFIYHGSATGINLTPAATVESNKANAHMGSSVASSGDVNGDGYSDVIVGADAYSNGETGEGAAFVYLGSTTGINTTAAAIMESNQAGASMGNSVASAGDVNGDGYSDLIVGADQYDNGQTGEGEVFIYHGNDPGNNKRNNLRLYNADLTTPVNSISFSSVNFGVGLFARSYLGRNKGKLVWETRLNGNAYSGNPITNSTLFTAQQSSYTNLALAGVELKNVITKLPGKYIRIRARVKYSPAMAITGQVYGPWRNVENIINGSSLGVIPLKLISFNAAWLQKGRSAKLDFVTENESNICCFDIEKSSDGFNFSTIGTITATNTSRTVNYSFVDAAATVRTLYYRLKIKSTDGKVEYSNIQLLKNGNGTEIILFPNPTVDVLKLQLNDNYDKMKAQILNSNGQLVQEMILQSANRTISIPVQQLASGNYWLRLQGSNEKQLLQFVKQ